MEKKAYMVVGLALLIVALASFGAYARGMTGKSHMTGKSQPLACSRTDLVGAVVKSPKGDVIGIVDRIEDDGGQSFAIINHGPDSLYGEGGGFAAVPISALKIEKSSSKDQLTTVVLKKSEKQLESGPFWDPTKMNDRKYDAKIDKFFGAHPSLCG